MRAGILWMLAFFMSKYFHRLHNCNACFDLGKTSIPFLIAEFLMATAPHYRQWMDH
jgi:hypothetical protein